VNRVFQLEIVTPTRYVNLENVEYLRAPGADGLFGVAGGHASALIALGVGELKVTVEGNEAFWSTSGGYAEITPEKVQLLLETAETAAEIDSKRAQDAIERAQKRLGQRDVDEKRAQAALMRAINRLRVRKRF